MNPDATPIERWPGRRARARRWTALCLLTFAWAPILWRVRRRTARRILTPEQAPRVEWIVVLGAPVRRGLTAVLEDRLLTALALHRAGRADRVLLTGTAAEVAAMREVVLRAGLPEQALQLDPESASTFESLARLPTGEPLLLVSQRFHLPRSLYLADRLGVAASGVSADRRPYRHALRYQLREVVGSVLAFWMARGGRGA